MFIPGETSAVIPTEWVGDKHGNRFAKRWRTIAYESLTEIEEFDS